MPDSALTDGTVLTSSFYTANVRNQVIATVTSGTRPSGTQGQHIFETDTNREYVYSGSGWVEWGGIGTWTSYTPILTQSGAVTKTVTYAKFSKIGRTVSVNMRLDVTGSGTASNIITVSMPFTAATANDLSVGSGWLYDASGPFVATFSTIQVSTTTFGGWDTTQGVAVKMGQAGCIFSAALGASDIVSLSATYEAAS